MTQTCKDIEVLAESLDAALFRALSDPTRLSLVVCLAKCCGPATVSQVASCCSVDLSVVSRHLSILAEAGVVESHRDGRQVRYRLRFEALATAFRSLAASLEACQPPEGGRRRCRGVCCTEGSCCV